MKNPNKKPVLQPPKKLTMGCFEPIKQGLFIGVIQFVLNYSNTKLL